MNTTIQAKALTTVQLRMLDIGAPVIVPCQTLTGDIVEVRLQTGRLEPASRHGPDPADHSDGGRNDHAIGSWEAHGAYVAIMPSGVDYGR